MRTNSKMFESVFTVAALILFSGGVLIRILPASITIGDQTLFSFDTYLNKSIFLVLYFISFCLVAKKYKTVLRALLNEKSIILLIAFAWISIAWSDAQWPSFRRAASLLGTTLFGIYFAIRYNSRERMVLLGWAFAVISLLSLLCILFYPEFGVMSGDFHAKSWRGIYSHKNGLGLAMALAIPTWLFLASGNRHAFLWICLLSITGLILLIFSTSKSSMIISSLMLLLLSWYGAKRDQNHIKWFALGAGLISGGYLILHITANIYAPMILANLSTTVLKKPLDIESAPPLTDKTGSTLQSDGSLSAEKKSITAKGSLPLAVKNLHSDLPALTGRIKLWSAVWPWIQKQPWFGYGYGGFWLGNEGPPTQIWQHLDMWRPSNSHNGILDLWLEMGLAGLLIFLFGLVATTHKSVTVCRGNGSPENIFPMVIIASIMLVNITESNLLRHDSIGWVLYVSIAISQTKRSILDIR